MWQLNSVGNKPHGMPIIRGFSVSLDTFATGAALPGTIQCVASIITGSKLKGLISRFAVISSARCLVLDSAQLITGSPRALRSMLIVVL